MELTPEQQSRQRVVSAACRQAIPGYQGLQIIASPRHFDSTCRAIIDMLPESERDQWYHAEQGFVDNFGNFLDRRQAYKIAKAANQILYRCGGDEGVLFSENLY